MTKSNQINANAESVRSEVLRMLRRQANELMDFGPDYFRSVSVIDARTEEVLADMHKMLLELSEKHLDAMKKIEQVSLLRSV